MTDEKSDGRGQKQSRVLRLTVLIAILVFSTFLGIVHLYPVGG